MAVTERAPRARALAPALGDRMIGAEFLGKPVVVRELLPQDLKVEIEQLTRAQACKAARYLGKSHKVTYPELAAWLDRHYDAPVRGWLRKRFLAHTN